MRKTFLVILTFVLVCACAEKEYTLSADPETLSLSADAETGSLTIHGSNGHLEITRAPQWLRCEVADSVLSYSAEENSDDERADSIVVVCGKSRLAIPVVQSRTATFLLPANEEMHMSRGGNTTTMLVQCDGNVKVKCNGPVQAYWEDNTLIVQGSPNEGKTREIPIELTAGSLTATVIVVQEGDECPTCGGSGTVTCSRCNGEGEYWADSPYMGYYGCRQCGGRGYAYRTMDPDYRKGSGRMTCPQCKGKG